MKRFHSYGPVKPDDHFYAKRTELVQSCLKQMIGKPEKGGHYFTIWGARQTGKTWLMEEAEREIHRVYPESFAVLRFSVGVLRELDDQAEFKGDHDFPKKFGAIIKDYFPSHPMIMNWDEFKELFSKENGLWDRPLLLFIDEVDSCPKNFLDILINRFREMYLNPENHWLHGLALTGVRAVLGVDSKKGSPFNVQRSLHVPNLSKEEVEDMFEQYRQESGQEVDSEVVTQLYEKTLGQPGLIGWFGELLTEKYNPGQNQTIDLKIWQRVWLNARTVEPNNTVLNLIAKARSKEYMPFLAKLFSHSEIPFVFHNPLHNYLYLNGIINYQRIVYSDRREGNICRFTSPFVQDCLYSALSDELIFPAENHGLINLLDDLADVLEDDQLNLPALLERYKAYLSWLKTQGINPWKEQPRRKQDFNLTEAVGHFHLYSWLQEVLKHRCVISPEFPTGNGKVDLHLKYGQKRGIIEVKSFQDVYLLKEGQIQASTYAQQQGMNLVTIALFVSTDDESVLEKLSGTRIIDSITVHTVAISWT